MNECSRDPAYVVHCFILVPVPGDRKRSPRTLFQGVMRTQTANLLDAYLPLVYSLKPVGDRRLACLEKLAYRMGSGKVLALFRTSVLGYAHV